MLYNLINGFCYEKRFINQGKKFKEKWVLDKRVKEATGCV